jgi:hypothetical protein
MEPKDVWLYLSTLRPQRLSIGFYKKLLPVAVTFLHRSCIRIVIYLDDLIVGSSTEECSTSVALVIKTLQSLGFLINFKKSETTPVQIIEYIGLITNSISKSFHFTKKKVDDIKQLSQETLKKKKCSLWELAKIIGNVNWAIYAVKFTQSHFRALQALYKSVPKKNLDRVITINREARDNMLWWLSEADFSSGKPILTRRPDLQLASDASRTVSLSRCSNGWPMDYKGTTHSNKRTRITSSTKNPLNVSQPPSETALSRYRLIKWRLLFTLTI